MGREGSAGACQASKGVDWKHCIRCYRWISVLFDSRQATSTPRCDCAGNMEFAGATQNQNRIFTLSRTAETNNSKWHGRQDLTLIPHCRHSAAVRSNLTQLEFLPKAAQAIVAIATCLLLLCVPAFSNADGSELYKQGNGLAGFVLNEPNYFQEPLDDSNEKLRDYVAPVLAAPRIIDTFVEFFINRSLSKAKPFVTEDRLKLTFSIVVRFPSKDEWRSLQQIVEAEPQKSIPFGAGMTVIKAPPNEPLDELRRLAESLTLLKPIVFSRDPESADILLALDLSPELQEKAFEWPYALKSFPERKGKGYAGKTEYALPWTKLTLYDSSSERLGADIKIHLPLQNYWQEQIAEAIWADPAWAISIGVDPSRASILQRFRFSEHWLPSRIADGPRVPAWLGEARPLETLLAMAERSLSPKEAFWNGPHSIDLSCYADAHARSYTGKVYRALSVVVGHRNNALFVGSGSTYSDDMRFSFSALIVDLSLQPYAGRFREFFLDELSTIKQLIENKTWESKARSSLPSIAEKISNAYRFAAIQLKRGDECFAPWRLKSSFRPI